MSATQFNVKYFDNAMGLGELNERIDTTGPSPSITLPPQQRRGGFTTSRSIPMAKKTVADIDVRGNRPPRALHRYLHEERPQHQQRLRGS